MKNKFLAFTIIFICITSLGTLHYYIQNKNFISSYVDESIALDKTINENNEILDNLNSDISYHSSDEFIEKVAREKLGLVMDDEIIFIEN